jgi:hypothetical protein
MSLFLEIVPHYTIHSLRAGAIYLGFIYFNYLLFTVLGLELRVYTFSHSTSPFFCEGLFEIRSPKLFAHAGFKLRSY